jgi:hypothetical protein
MIRSSRSAPRAALGLIAVTAALVLGASPASAAITYRSSTTNTAAATNSIVLSTPADVQVGDVMVASVALVGASAPGTEAATYTWSLASGSLNWDGGIVDYAGVSATPLDRAASSGGNSGNAACTGVTTTTANDLVIVAAADRNIVTFTPPTSMTERFELGQTGVSLEHSDVLQAAVGATGTKTATPSNNGQAWACHVVSLKPSTGTLAVTSPGGAPAFSLTLNGLDQTATYTPTLSVTDTRTASSGWNLQVTSTQFTAGGGGTLPTTASAVTGVTRACNTGSTCGTLPTTNVTYPFTVPAGTTPPTAVKLYNAASGTGGGIVTVTPSVDVTVPGNAKAGSYSSTLTVTVASGP